MIFPGVLMLGMAFLYYRYTADTPQGNFNRLRANGHRRTKPDWSILADIRLWALAAAYAVCFGMELTFDNVAALHFVDTFHLRLSTAGFWAGTFGFMNLFARALGGYFSDSTGRRYGLKGKGLFLAGVLLLEGLGLELFAGAGTFLQAIACMFFFAFFLKMANGGTFGIVPFINEKNVGLASGIVGASGNLGGVLFGFLFKSKILNYAGAFHYIGYIVIAVALLVAMTRFNPKTKTEEVSPGLSVA
jgi:NNP family nitrate/nitrite transporter-like MFS transporter